jgi:glycosyltransferase involved in cell wall biosynthesis
MPRILRILNRLNIGGPTYNAAYLSADIGRGYTTRVLAGHKEPDEGSSEYLMQERSVDYAYVPGMYRKIDPANDWKAFRYICSEINRFRPDIVHTHAAKAGALGRLAANFSRYRPKVVLHTYHGNVFDGYFSPFKTRIILAIERYLGRKSTCIIAISEAQKKDLAEVYRIAPADKIAVVRLGFDLQRFVTGSEEKRRLFREHYRLADDEVVITITGRLAPVKNHSLFIAALAELRRLVTDARFRVFIIGDGELFGQTVSETRSAGFSVCLPSETAFDADVIFTSWRRDIDVINAGSDIIALTSVNEGTPVSIIEAQASGKAVVCTDVGGVKDVVSDGETGYLSRQEPFDFSQKLAQLIRDSDLRARLGRAGQESALRNYSVTRLISDMQALYRQLLEKEQ